MRFIKKIMIKAKPIRRLLYMVLGLVFATKLIIFYFVCGLVDILRNEEKQLQIFKQYFLGHGTFTWLMAPFNLFIDFLCLPNWNKGIFNLDDLPGGHQKEIRRTIDIMKDRRLVSQLEGKLNDSDREMIFFKWYGKNIKTSIDIPEFHESFKYIRTIGISIFNKKKSTNKHFGPFRLTYRVLVNLNEINSDEVYIQVGSKKNYWHQNKMFIFDDTLQHQSINESNERRYCAFIDILRPSPFSLLLKLINGALGSILNGANHLFYNRWRFIQ